MYRVRRNDVKVLPVDEQPKKIAKKSVKAIADKSVVPKSHRRKKRRTYVA